jgi:ribosome biogenesis protein BRX1
VQLDATDSLAVVNDIAESKSCKTTLFFDVKKKRDLYLWLSHTPTGPSIKFHVVNVHTMDELRLTGNSLKGSRPILSFDRAFDDEERSPHLRLVRELLATAFATPRAHPKSQPFHDHVIHFGYIDGKVWLRNYQIVDKTVDAKEVSRMLDAGEQPTVLVEIGPRFVLDIVRIFAGSMGGPTLWENPGYAAPNSIRRDINIAKAGKYTARVTAEHGHRKRVEEIVEPENPVDGIFRDDVSDLDGDDE